MKFRQQDEPKPRKRRKARGHNSGLLVAHRAFAPLIGLWGVLLAGLTVMVLPPALIETALRHTMIASLGLPLQPILAGLTALVLGGGLFMIAAGLNRRARRRAGTPSVAERAVRSVRPIDPMRDLGSRSLDDPLETMPFASRGEEASEPRPEPAIEPAPAPRELDLAGFAAIPGRNAVWVEETPEPLPLAEAAEDFAAEPLAPEPVVSAPVTELRQSAPLPDPGTAALARLRAVAPSELSLAEMVERFAGALHEHRTSPPARALTAADLAAREAALAEALKALAALSGDTTGDHAREPLRAALAQLQTRRGAA